MRGPYTYSVALLPIIMVYNTPALNLSLGTVVLFLFLPYSFLCVANSINQRNKNYIGIIAIIFIYLYFVIRSQGDVRTILLYIAACIHLLGFASGSVDGNRFRAIFEKIAVISSICVLAQVFSYYLMGRTISFTILSALQRDYKIIYYGQVSRFSLYRPTGPFLEPSMLSEYCVIALVSCLFPVEGNIKIIRTGLITMGIILTTSGIGIVLSAFVYAWYVFIKRASLSKRVRNIFRAVVLATLAILIFSRFSFFNAAMMRVFTNFEGYNAIEGRLWRWSQAINPMKGKLLWLGYGATEDFGHYLTGIPDMVYRCGLAAVVLLFILLIYLIITPNDTFVKLSSIVYIILLFIAKITSVPYQVFFIGLMLIDTYRNQQLIRNN